jgi:hypothetical protein
LAQAACQRLANAPGASRDQCNLPIYSEYLVHLSLLSLLLRVEAALPTVAAQKQRVEGGAPALPVGMAEAMPFQNRVMKQLLE